MVPNLIWAPDFFGPREIWAPRNSGPKNVGPCMKMPYIDFHAGTNFLGTHISRGPKKSGAQMRLGTISVIAPKTPQPHDIVKCQIPLLYQQMFRDFFYAEFSIDMTARAASYKMHLCHASLIFRKNPKYYRF